MHEAGLTRYSEDTDFDWLRLETDFLARYSTTEEDSWESLSACILQGKQSSDNGLIFDEDKALRRQTGFINSFTRSSTYKKDRFSLVILRNNSEFEKAVLWLSENLTFDVDARINLFECNIRVLGGLVSAHILATDSANRLTQGIYVNQLLILAEDLGSRFLRAFDTPTGLPYAWINLKYGVMKNETTETSTSGCGSLILEMGTLSRLTGDSRYELAALRALRKLWSMRSPLNLLGTTLDVISGEWIEYSSGIGADMHSALYAADKGIFETVTPITLQEWSLNIAPRPLEAPSQGIRISSAAGGIQKQDRTVVGGLYLPCTPITFNIASS
ncbi:hypothetical protein GIB67_039018 [Kingdonia uniflora]|uniref:alpha-1,2-Mannosidase n=1 Tax=Kingdonia uniflora TaxID=39325 RepID=A0A7J7LKP5_9MAGN|nr:hypothetical protein GIB67_039018 [Kingdonia uniflora]